MTGYAALRERGSGGLTKHCMYITKLDQHVIRPPVSLDVAQPNKA